MLLKTVLAARPVTPDEGRAHLANLDALAKAGKLAAAGPVLEGSDLAWILVFVIHLRHLRPHRIILFAHSTHRDHSIRDIVIRRTPTSIRG